MPSSSQQGPRKNLYLSPVDWSRDGPQGDQSEPRSRTLHTGAEEENFKFPSGGKCPRGNLKAFGSAISDHVGEADLQGEIMTPCEKKDKSSFLLTEGLLSPTFGVFLSSPRFGFGGIQNVPPQNMPLGYVDYFELKALEEEQVQERRSALPFLQT